MRISSVKPVPWLPVNLHHLVSDGVAVNTQSRSSLTSYAINSTYLNSLLTAPTDCIKETQVWSPCCSVLRGIKDEWVNDRWRTDVQLDTSVCFWTSHHSSGWCRSFIQSKALNASERKSTEIKSHSHYIWHPWASIIILCSEVSEAISCLLVPCESPVWTVAISTLLQPSNKFCAWRQHMKAIIKHQYPTPPLRAWDADKRHHQQHNLIWKRPKVTFPFSVSVILQQSEYGSTCRSLCLLKRSANAGLTTFVCSKLVVLSSFYSQSLNSHRLKTIPLTSAAKEDTLSTQSDYRKYDTRPPATPTATLSEWFFF